MILSLPGHAYVHHVICYTYVAVFSLLKHINWFLFTNILTFNTPFSTILIVRNSYLEALGACYHIYTVYKSTLRVQFVW